MQRRSIDQRALAPRAFAAIIALEAAEKNPHGHARVSGRVVQWINRKRRPHMCEMHPDLMCLARPGKYPQQRVVTKRPLQLPHRSRRPPAVLQDSHAIALRWMSSERCVDFPFMVRRSSNDDSEVLFLDGVVLKLMRKMPLRREFLREQQHAARVLVQSMHDTQSRIACTGMRQVDLTR